MKYLYKFLEWANSFDSTVMCTLATLLPYFIVSIIYAIIVLLLIY
jgi:hypothetical protein